MNGKILLYNTNFIKKAQISSLCGKLGLELISVEEKDYAKPLGELAGNIKSPAGASKGRTPFKDEMMVMCIGEGPDKFLDEYKKVGIESIALKAVLTGFNMKWSSYKLHDELSKERNAIG